MNEHVPGVDEYTTAWQLKRIAPMELLYVLLILLLVTRTFGERQVSAGR